MTLHRSSKKYFQDQIPVLAVEKTLNRKTVSFKTFERNGMP